MEGNLNNSNLEDQNLNNQNVSIVEERKKGSIVLPICCALLFVIGLVIGPIILKAASKNVSDGSFMYKVLDMAGYNLNVTEDENEKEEAVEPERNKFYFSTESNGYYYYYIIDENGDYIYYYSDNNMYDMHWYATDANGRYVGIPYEIYKYDYTSPNLYLYGDDEITLTVGTEFEDPGYSAYDSEDGNLTTNVIRSGNLNSSLPGEYILVYTVKDKANNSTTKVRKVTYMAKEEGELNSSNEEETNENSNEEETNEE